MPAVTVPTGTPAPTLTTTVTCPVCDAVMAWVNGAFTQSRDGVGTDAVALLYCAKHGTYEVRCTLRRAQVPPARVSGAQQRQRAQARHSREAVTQ